MEETREKSSALLLHLVVVAMKKRAVESPLPNVKTAPLQKILFNLSTVSMSKTVPLQTIQFSINTLFKCKYTV